MIDIVGPDLGPVAKAKLTYRNNVPGPKGLDLPSVEVFYFKAIDLVPTVVFRHLCGVALNTWLDRCFLSDNENPNPTLVGPCRYVHGKSEVMKGRHLISAVLLTLLPDNLSFSETQWQMSIPELYRNFLTVLDLSATEKPSNP